MNIYVKVSRDSILEDFFGTDEDAERSCQNFERELKAELEATIDCQAEVEITESTDNIRIDGERTDLGWELLINDITDTVYSRFTWVEGE